MTMLALRRTGLDVVAEAVRAVWSAETSAFDDWTADEPTRGQCAVTALIVQDHLGGDLLRGEIDGISHYWNRLDDGRHIDLTREQFISFAPANIELRTRAYVLSFPDTHRRYDVLRSRFLTAG